MHRPLVPAAVILSILLLAGTASAQIERDTNSRSRSGYSGVSRDVFTSGRTAPQEEAAPEVEAQISPYLITTAMVVSFSIRGSAREFSNNIDTLQLAQQPVEAETSPPGEEASIEQSVELLVARDVQESTPPDEEASIEQSVELLTARDVQETVSAQAAVVEAPEHITMEDSAGEQMEDRFLAPLKLDDHSFGNFPDAVGGTPHDAGGKSEDGKDAIGPQGSVEEQVDQPDFLANDPNAVSGPDAAVAADISAAARSLPQLNADGKGILAFNDGSASFAIPDAALQADLGLPAQSPEVLAGLPVPDWSTIRIPSSITTLSRGNRRKRQVALTFDDGPHPEYTEQILKILDYYDVPATFFFVGIQCVKYPQLVQETCAEGHEIGSQTYDHFRMPNLPEDEKEYQIDEYQLLIKRLVGKEPRFLRPPGGQVDDQTKALLKQRGIILALWDVALNDTKDGKTAQEMFKTAKDQVRPGSVILAHDGVAATVELLPELIEELRRQGYEFVTMSQLASGL